MNGPREYTEAQFRELVVSKCQAKATTVERTRYWLLPTRTELARTIGCDESAFSEFMSGKPPQPAVLAGLGFERRRIYIDPTTAQALSIDDVRDLILERAAMRPMHPLCAEIGCGLKYMREVMAGRAEPSATMATWLALTPGFVYIQTRKSVLDTLLTRESHPSPELPVPTSDLPPGFLSDDQVIHMLKERLLASGKSKNDFARSEIDIFGTTFNDILTKKVPVSAKALKYLGLERVRLFQKQKGLNDEVDRNSHGRTDRNDHRLAMGEDRTRR
jgi:hypothetical protein